MHHLLLVTLLDYSCLPGDLFLQAHFDVHECHASTNTLAPSAPQTPSSTPQSTHDDKHAFSSICTPTAQLTDLAKEALAMEAGSGIFRIAELSEYAPNGTPEQNITMENVVHGGKSVNTVQLGPIQSTTQHPPVV